MYCTITAEQTVCGAGCPARRYSRHAAAGRADAAGEGECAMEILRVEDVGHKYQAENGEVTAFEHISFTVQKGEFMSIVGPSGCGKSTLLSIIAGLLPPTSGRVYVDGEVVTGISRHIGYMLQRDNLLEWRTILSNVLFGLEIRGAKTPQNVARARELLKTYGLYEFRHKYPRQLSGGMRQRVMIAIALACEPKLLIADEPTTALDVTIQAQILELMMDLKEKLGMAIIMITHDLGIVARMCEKIAVMYAGKIVEYGTTDEIFYEPKHEYTKGLLRSIPRLDSKDHERLVPIEGTPVDMLNPPKGCPFAPRCGACMKVCLREMPPRTDFSDTHYTQCWLCQKAEFEAAQGGNVQ